MNFYELFGLASLLENTCKAVFVEVLMNDICIVCRALQSGLENLRIIFAEF